MADPIPDMRLQLERGLFRECLELAHTVDAAPLLARALGFLRQLVGADRGYIELLDTTDGEGRRWWTDENVDDDQRAAIRRRVSQGIVAAAVEDDEIIHTQSAMLDERFSSRASVRDNQIEEVLCVPLRAEGAVGVVYLQNRSGAEPFGEHAISSVRTVAGFAASTASRLLEVLRHRNGTDPTAVPRERLRAPDVIGRSPALAAFLERLVVVAPMTGNTLLTGPSGAGKSMFARVIHDNSKRAAGPFVELNCAALPENLVESELFGAERGAHSGVASRGAPGKVLAAEGGTLFLDEVGELGRGVQAKLLQLLQAKEYHPLGSTKPTTADVRIVAATNVDLLAAQRTGAFREDLYYRMAGIELRVPSLEDRREDIPVLAQTLIERVCSEEGLPQMKLTSAGLAVLEFSDWPGNVRQLMNVCKSAVINARISGSSVVETSHLFPESRPAKAISGETLQSARDAFETSFLTAALRDQNWNVAKTARDVDLSRSHLNALIRKHGLRR